MYPKQWPASTSKGGGKEGGIENSPEEYGCRAGRELVLVLEEAMQIVLTHQRYK